MPNQPISGLSSGVAVSDTDLFANTQATAVGPAKTTALQLKQYIGTNLSLTNPTIVGGNLTLGAWNVNFPTADGSPNQVLTTDGSGNLFWSGQAGAVTSVDVTGGGTGLTFTGGPITSSGVIGMFGTLNIGSGGTGATTAMAAALNLLPPIGPATASYALFNDGGSSLYWAAAGSGGGGGTGTVTSVGTTLSGLTVANQNTTPVISGTLGASSGGTGLNGSVGPVGAIPINTGSGYLLSRLIAGPGVVINDTAFPGRITISSVSGGNVTSFTAVGTGLTPNVISTGAIALGGVLNVAHGGTGLSSVGPNGSVMYSTGGTIAYTSSGVTGTYLAGNTSAAPSWNLAKTTVGSTVLTLGGTTPILENLTYVSVTQDPASSMQLTTKRYVDNITSPINRLAPVQAATTVDIGAFPFSGTGYTIDTYAVQNGDRILVKDQTLSQNDGVWIVGAPWTRAIDLDQSAEFTAASAFVLNGSVNKNTSWIQTLSVATPGTSAQNWVQQSGVYVYTDGPGINITGTQIDNDGVLTFSGGTTGLTPSVATKGNIVLGGTLQLTNGGTGGITAQGARTNILPTQTGNTGKFLQTDGSDVIWADLPSRQPSYYIPVNVNDTVANFLINAGYPESNGLTVVFYNTDTVSHTITGTVFVNTASFPSNSTSTTISIRPGQSATIQVVDGVAHNYSIINISTVAVFSDLQLNAGGSISTIMAANNVPEVAGAIVTFENLFNGTITITGATILGTNAYLPAATPTAVKLQKRQSLTIVVISPASTYQVINLTRANQSYGTTSNENFTNIISGIALICGDIVTYYNSSASSVTFSGARVIDNWRSYPANATATTFTVAADSSLTFQLLSPTDSDWTIVNYATPSAASGNTVMSWTALGDGSPTNFNSDVNFRGYLDGTAIWKLTSPTNSSTGLAQVELSQNGQTSANGSLSFQITSIDWTKSVEVEADCWQTGNESNPAQTGDGIGISIGATTHGIIGNPLSLLNPCNPLGGAYARCETYPGGSGNAVQGFYIYHPNGNYVGGAQGSNVRQISNNANSEAIQYATRTGPSAIAAAYPFPFNGTFRLTVRLLRTPGSPFIRIQMYINGINVAASRLLVTGWNPGNYIVINGATGGATALQAVSRVTVSYI